MRARPGMGYRHEVMLDTSDIGHAPNVLTSTPKELVGDDGNRVSSFGVSCIAVQGVEGFRLRIPGTAVHGPLRPDGPTLGHSVGVWGSLWYLLLQLVTQHGQLPMLLQQQQQQKRTIDVRLVCGSDSTALVLYSPTTSLHGLYYNEQLHGPFATGRSVNPFTPGLSPLSSIPKPSYVTGDVVRERFPAMRSEDDPLNWITDQELDMRGSKMAANQQRVPLRCQSSRN
ncbi:hypothetical protein VOLCADRAFT_96463 [Volvox carteri f. nagariensis]|uniref:Uncharacterized protein n=1 Tax=Volvox carteri f. nagariensis TaxID=3068 RepID=D8UA64_VOLCA|nr:uncharacterized protein VOLCADRAFT_96463 [Volvox carteri f. nagariensis]EFJ43372.1 hypothetical protein VOLCADRAFT_96463 [Volvox carteri f. nagariensis]|eukprot:XP_002955519.1 hypothetical protein VOLCADRAFT_96463 [Volvox carteri f. nagariensis]